MPLLKKQAEVTIVARVLVDNVDGTLIDTNLEVEVDEVVFNGVEIRKTALAASSFKAALTEAIRDMYIEQKNIQID